MQERSTIGIILSLLFLYNCGGGGIAGIGGGSSSSTTFLEKGTSLTYNSSTASTWQSRAEFDNINAHGSSTVTPYESINLHKAYGYGLSGDGKTIAILDHAFATAHTEFAKKTISTYGTLTTAEGDSGEGYHGNFVAGIAAADYNDNSDPSELTVVSYSNPSGDIDTMMGVAYNADLHFADYEQKGSNTYYADHWASATTDAKNSSAIVQNNSWGFTNEAYNSSTNYTSASIATLATNSGLTSNATSINNFVRALNQFQDKGVIVYALSNVSGLGDADVAAALPEIYTSLNEAWITVGNVEITGSSGSETYTRKSAICGSTAAYCLVADGFEVFSVSNIIGSNDYVQGVSDVDMTTKKSGTSFAAPQISGLIAILSEAFPTQTPSQLTDRLLASADNSFFTATSSTTFANGITHGYNTTYGHGVPDIYAALQPITSSRMSESILIGDTIENATVHNLKKSNFSNGIVFGDSISNSFKGKKSYFYDALYGAFEYNFDNHLVNDKPKRITNLENSFDENRFESFSATDKNYGKNFNYSFVVDENNYLVPEKGISYSVSNHNYNLNTSYNYPLDINLGYISSEDIKTFNNKENILLPYLTSKDNSYNMSSNIFKNKDTNISLGYMQTEDRFSLDKKGYVLSYSNLKKDNAILAGITTENGGFLDNKFNGAFSLDENDNPTNFIAFRQNAKLGKNELMFVTSYGSSKVSTSPNSLITKIDNVNTTSFSANLSRKELFNKKDRIIFSISQPQRVENGIMTYLVPKLNDKDGTLNYNQHETKLEPSGRQIDFALYYILNLSENTNLSFQGKVIDDYFHVAKDRFDASLMTSFRYKF